MSGIEQSDEIEYLRRKLDRRMSESVWVVIPYAGEDRTRLAMTAESAHETRAHVYIVSAKDTLPVTINRGVRKASGYGATHICWLSTGDTLHRDRFEHPLPDDRGQCCLVDVHRRGGAVTLPDLETDWQRNMYTDNQFCGSGMVVPVHVWDAVGGFDESLTYCSDWDFAVRVQHQFGWECVPEVLAEAHEYADGMTRTADVKVRQRDRARVSAMANRLRKQPTPAKNPT